MSATSTAHDRWHQTAVATCKRKQTYLSWTTASNAATILSWLGRNLQPYSCPICGNYHLTKHRTP